MTSAVIPGRAANPEDREVESGFKVAANDRPSGFCCEQPRNDSMEDSVTLVFSLCGLDKTHQHRFTHSKFPLSLNCAALRI